MSKDGSRDCTVVLLSVALVCAVAALVPLAIIAFSDETGLRADCQCPLFPPAGRTSTPTQPSTTNGDNETEAEEGLARPKRSMRSPFGVNTKVCPLGFTGQYCQYAVCPNRIPITTPSNGMTGFGIPIDVTVLKNCMNQKLSIAVDSSVQKLYFMLDGDTNSSPSLSVTMPNGQPAVLTIVAHTSAQIIASVAAPIPGIWLLTFSATNPCIVFTMALTKLSVNDGIVSGSSALQSDSPSRILFEKIPSFFVAHANTLQYPGKINFLEVYESNVMTWSNQAQTRYNCSYETYFGQIDCSHTHSYYYKMFGMDAQGYQFQRTNTILCQNVSVTTPAPATTVRPGECLNGGTKVGTNVCICPPFFSGPQCQNFMCLHGGTLGGNGQCSCAPGYYGSHCEKLNCHSPTQYNFDTQHRSLAIVFNNRVSMRDDWVQLVQTAQSLVNAFNKKHPSVVLNYVLTTFVDNTISTVTYNASSYFLSGLANLITTLKPSKNCSQPVLGALSSTLKAVLPRSPIYIFTDALASDYGSQETVMHLDSFWMSEMYFILSNRTGTPADSPVCPTSVITAPGLTVYESLAKFSTGQLITVAKSKIGALVTALFPNNYGTDSIFSADYLACSRQPSYTTFLVDTSVSALFIYGGAPPGFAGVTQTLAITGPDGKPISAFPAVTIGNVVGWVISGPKPGIYQVTYATSMPSQACTLRVRGVTKLIMFYAVTNNVIVDRTNVMPTYNLPANVIVHVNGLSVAQGQQFGGEISIKSASGNVKFLSSGQIRSNCQYQMFFAPYTCSQPGQILYVTFYGTDNNGVSFQRTRAGFCSPSPVTPAPPTSCQNGGVPTSPSSGHCVCPFGWTGQYCSQANCFNGGVSLGQQCDCPAGWTGPFCTQNNCFSKNDRVRISPGNRSLAFVVQLTPSMQSVVTQIIGEIDAIVHLANVENPQWFGSYILVTFTDTTSQVAYNGASQAAFVTAVKAMTITGHSSTCERNVINALAMGMVLGVTYGNAFVFTDGGAADYYSTGHLYTLLQHTKTTVSFVLTNPNPCNANFTTQPTTIYENIAKYTDGQFFPISPNVVNQVLRYIPTLYSSGMVHATSSETCMPFGSTGHQPLSIFFPIESAATGFTISATGFGVQIQLFDPTGKLYKYAYPMVNGSYVSILHAYHKTGNLGDPFVPGIWSAKISVAQHPAELPGCSIWVRAQSPVQVFYGFMQTSYNTLSLPVHNDFPESEPEVALGVVNYMIAHVDGLSTTPGHLAGHLDYMNNFADANGALLSSSSFTRRVNCGFEYISLPFVCPQLFYTAVLSGFDAQGFAFNRLRPAMCLPGTPTITTTVAPLPCSNGGIYVSSKKRCICPNYYNGTLCQTVVCMNGGTSTGSSCTCPPAFTGPFCTIDMCTPHASKAEKGGLVPNYAATPEQGPNGRSMAWVVQNSATMYPDISALQAGVDNTVTQIQAQNASWITSWILVTFTDSLQHSSVLQTSDPAKFIAAVKAISPFSYFGKNCSKLALHGIYQALEKTSKYGYVYTFTDSSTADFGYEMFLLPLLESTKASLSFVVTSPEPCNQDLSQNSFQLLSGISDGQLFITTKDQVKEVLEFLPWLYQSSLAEMRIVQNCVAGTTLYFPLDSMATGFSIIVVGHSATATIYDPNGNQYTHALPVISGDAYSLVYHVYKRSGNLGHGVIPGQWSVKVASTPDTDFGPSCLVQVRVQSSVAMYYGFAGNLHSDLPVPEPVYNRTNYMIAHMTGLGGTVPGVNGALEYATLYNETFIQVNPHAFSDPTEDSNWVQEGAFSFQQRQGCGFEYVSQPFRCPNLALGVIASGHDAAGYLFQRIRVAICFPSLNPGNPTTIAPSTPTTPKPIKCYNGGVGSGGVCYCRPMFTGAQCATSICTNGGTSSGGACSCPPGFTGAHCETSDCSKPNPYNKFSPEGRSFALVLQSNLYTSYDRQLVHDNVDAMVANMHHKSSTWISKWILVIYNETAAIRVVSTSNVTAFVIAVKAQKTSALSGISCPVAIGHGLQEALTASSPYGYVYVFTQGVINDVDYLTSTTFASIESSRAQVSFVVSNARPCGQPWLTANTTTFTQVAALSDGQIFVFESQDIPTVMYKYIPQLYNTALAYESGQVDCWTTPQVYYFPVDSHTSLFTLTVSAFNATVRIIDPLQHAYTPTTFDSGFFLNIFQSKASPAPGMWTVYVGATAPTIGCRVQVRVTSDIQVYYGFTQSPTNDFPDKEPHYPMPPAAGYNYMVAHATGLGNPGANMAYMQMFHPNGTLANALSFAPRAHCDYSWISQPFVCPNYYFLISMNGIDENGYPWYRIRTAICIFKSSTGENPEVQKIGMK